MLNSFWYIQDFFLIFLRRKHESGIRAVLRNAPAFSNITMWDEVLILDGSIESIGKTPGAHVGDGFGIITPDAILTEVDPEAGDKYRNPLYITYNCNLVNLFTSISSCFYLDSQLIRILSITKDVQWNR